MKNNKPLLNIKVMKILRQVNFSKKADDEKAKEKTKKMRLKAGGSLVAGGALGMAIPVIAAKKLEEKAGDKISSANKRIAAKRGLDYTIGKGLLGEPLIDINGKPIMQFMGSIDKLEKIKDASAVSKRYADKVNAKAIKNMKKANAAGLAATALGAAAAGTIAYKHYKNKKKEDSDKK